MSEAKHLRLKVLLVSRRKDMLDSLEGALGKHPGIHLEHKLIVNGHVDPLHDVDVLPDALVLHLAENSRAELESLAARAVNRRPPLIVVGASSDPAIMRMAMHAGARDLLPLPLVENDLVAALRRIERDHSAAAARGEASVTAFMNAKGGCGATLLACNVAHMFASLAHRRVALLDLDLQFGAIPVYFDLFPKRGVMQVLENIDSLDEVSFDGYLVEHASGLKILGHAAEDPLSTHAVSAQQVQKLLDVAVRAHDHVVIDLPRRIDPTTALILERAPHIVIVVQQSVATLRDATRLMNWLRRELGVSKDRIVTVVNRYQKDSGITTEDIRTTLGCGELSLVPNDFRNVSVCLDTGAPLLTHAPGAAVTRAAIALQTRLGGAAIETQGFLARKLSGLMKSRTT